MKYKARSTVIITLLSVIAIILAVSVFWFSGRIEKALINTNDTYLTEVTDTYRYSVETKIKDRLLMLEILGRNFIDVDFNDYNAVKNAINSTNNLSDFNKISVVTPKGTTMNNDNTSSGNSSNRDWFKKAMLGEANVALNKSENGEDCLIFASPVLQDNAVKCILVAELAKSNIEGIFGGEILGQKGMAFLINSEGKIIVQPPQTEALITNENFFDTLLKADSSSISVERLKNNISNKYTGVLEYSLGSKSYKAVYISTGINDWYIISTVSGNMFDAQKTEMMLYVALFISIITAVFVFIFISDIYLNIQLIRLGKKYTDIKKKYEILSKLDTQVQCSVFDYNYEDNTVYYSGHLESMLFKVPDGNEMNNINEFIDNVHEYDVEIVREFIKNMYNGKKHKVCEFRLRSVGGGYSWFRIDARIISDNEGHPLRLAGTFTNTDCCKVKETEINLFSENNEMTGILKKDKFKELAQNTLKYADSEQFFGIYIIDLDKFKSVNERMGHDFGNCIIDGVARKLGLIFSEKDYIARTNGDEFAVLLNLDPNMSKVDIQRVIRKKGDDICRMIRQKYTYKDREYNITASVGISIYRTDGKEYKMLMEKADKAMKTAKKQGGNKYIVYNIESCGGIINNEE